MSRVQGHVTGEQILRYADGELNAGESRAVQAHLEACWQCRAELTGIETTIADCIRYRDALRREVTPPEPWPDILPLLARAGRQEPVPAWRKAAARMAALFRPAPLVRWAPGALALLLVAVLVYRLRETPSVKAAQILRQAVNAAELRKEGNRPVQVQVRGSKWIRTAAHSPAELAPVAAAFTAARYDWNDPLSARSFAAWRDSLSDPIDAVTSRACGVSGENCYQITTSTASGELAAATLWLRAADLQALEAAFDFRAFGRVELSALPEIPPVVSRAEPAVGPPAAPALPQPLPAEPLGPAAAPAPVTAAEELRVLEALHRIQADLGDPIHVSPAGEKILVSGAGVDPGRQQLVRSALAPFSRVEIRFTDDVPPAGGGTPAASEARSGTLDPLQKLLEQRLGGKPALDRFADRTLEASDAVLARIHALRRLAAAFPAAREAGLSGEDRRSLAALRADHARVLQHSAGQLAQVMLPALESVGYPAPRVEGHLAADWQSACGELLQTARQVERHLGALLHGASDAPDAAARLAESVTLLKLQADAYAGLANAVER